MKSYAQLREDVILARALAHVPIGFYLDIGAYHPEDCSVTKHFYDQGWRGVNVEPSRRLFPRFLEERPRDVNIEAAVSDQDGHRIPFYDFDDQISTTVPAFAAQHEEDGRFHLKARYEVPTITLAEICRHHAPGTAYRPGPIHFLKLDVEGAEAAALKGMDFGTWRPWILIIEAAEPNHPERPSFKEWHPRVAGACYRYTRSDGVNRWYVAMERPELIAAVERGE